MPTISNNFCMEIIKKLENYIKSSKKETTVKFANSICEIMYNLVKIPRLKFPFNWQTERYLEEKLKLKEFKLFEIDSQIVQRLLFFFRECYPEEKALQIAINELLKNKIKETA